MNLGYEQFIALRVIRDTPDMEGADICKKADCSFDELFSLASLDLIDIGSERLQAFMTHPTITAKGILVLLEAEASGIV